MNSKVQIIFLVSIKIIERMYQWDTTTWPREMKSVNVALEYKGSIIQIPGKAIMSKPR